MKDAFRSKTVGLPQRWILCRTSNVSQMGNLVGGENHGILDQDVTTVLQR